MFDTFSSHVLDSPVAASVQGDWSQLAERVGTARVLPANIGHLADPSPVAGDFKRLLARQNRALFVVRDASRDLPRGVAALSTARIVQMVRAPQPLSAAPPIHHAMLSKADRPQMLRLAQQTKPGPFEIDTPSLGPFVGVEDCGRLVAMAGVRMGFAGWTEISGVCVDPMYRGLGLARVLVTALVKRIEGQGRRVFLHSYADNVAAIALYETLGFRIRKELDVSIIEGQAERLGQAA